MLEFTLDATADLEALAAVPAALDRQRPHLLGEIGRDLRERAHRDFLTKSRGGTGVDGVTWPALTPAEAQRKQRVGKPLIGVRTGTLGALSNIGVTLTDETVEVGFTDLPKALFFDESRSLLPERLPEPWYRAVTRTARDQAERLVESILPQE